ncbi:MAG: hypothetical protein DRN12_07850 [Thermoplasmata archaeon]|nr:MAG: hypothetical protein DRN12_07850 [Thermoplasmata archaeon]
MLLAGLSTPTSQHICETVHSSSSEHHRVAVDIIGLGLLVWNACLVNREEREIAKAAEGLLSTPERHDLEGRVAELERRVTNMDEEISSLARRMAVLEKPKDSKFQGCAS